MEQGNAGGGQGTLRTDSRNYGIDLLRVVAMFYVVVLHCLSAGGVLGAATPGSALFGTAWIMEIWTYGAVDIFALISGYVSCTENRKTSWTNYILLWLQVVFYGVAVMLVFNCFHPELVTKRGLLTMFFPVTNGLYWYLSAYTGLFVVMPLLDAGIRNCPEGTLRKLFVGLFVVFSLYESTVLEMDLSGGYSFVWITLLYLMGAIIRKCGIGSRLTFAHTMLGSAGLCLAAWLWKLFGKQIILGGLVITPDTLVSYISPAVVGAAALHLIGFSKLRFGGKMRKVIAFAAPAAFAVYILNCHGIIWAYVLSGNFAVLAGRSVPVMVLGVLAFSAVFLVAGILLDRGRIWLFGVFRVRKIVDRVVSAADRAVTKLTDKL